jgi:hypothetical protein
VETTHAAIRFFIMGGSPTPVQQSQQQGEQPQARIVEQLIIRTPCDGCHVCHSFVATGTVDPSGTQVTGKLLNTSGGLVANSTGCTTNQNAWSCAFQVPAGVAAGTTLLLVVNTNPPGTGDHLRVVVDAC